MLITSFSLDLDLPILPGLAACGAFDGQHISLALATKGQRVVLTPLPIPHSHFQPNPNPDPTFLNINRAITSLAAAPFPSIDPHQSLLFVGSPSNLLCYDVHNNKDIFFADVPDGVEDIAFGRLAADSARRAQEPLVYVGGNCSIQGFDSKGEEQFWTVTGGKVCSLAHSVPHADAGIYDVQIGREIPGGNPGALLVGGDDFEIRVFKEEESALEIVEADVVTQLCPLQLEANLEKSPSKSHAFMAYGLANGTVGVYADALRIWRIKAKDSLTAMVAFDINGDGIDEVVCAWSSGMLEARAAHDGRLIYREHFEAAIAALVVLQETLLCCTTQGKVLGIVGFEDITQTRTSAVPLSAGRIPESGEIDGELRGSFLPRRAVDGESKALECVEEEERAAEFAVRALEGRLKNVKDGGEHTDLPAEQLDGAEVTVHTIADVSNRSLELVVSIDNGLVLRSVIIVDADGTFVESGAHLSCTTQPNASSLTIPLRPRKYNQTALHLQVLASLRGATSKLHLFELEHKISKFKAFALASAEEAAAPDSNATFELPQRQLTLAEGLAAAFDVEVVDLLRSNGDCFDVTFVNVVKGSVLRVHVSSQEERKICTVYSEDMEVVAEMCQLVGTLANLNEMRTKVYFSHSFERLKSMLEYVHQSKKDRAQLQANVAQVSQQIKTLVVQAEDARILRDTGALKQVYQELASANQELFTQHKIRKTNHKALTEALKEINEIIQCAARMRKGKCQADVIKNARKALKMNSYTLLVQALASSA